jgi:hypothetical protein
MPPKTRKVTSAIVDSSKVEAQFKSLACQVGSDFETVMETINENKEHFTKTSNYTLALDPAHNSIFNNLFECCVDRKNLRILSIEVQRTGFATCDSWHYDLLPSKCMRILVVVKERGYSSVSMVVQERPVPVMIMSDALYTLPPVMSELVISSSNNVDGRKLKACKAIYVSFVAERINDAPMFNVANEFMGIEHETGGDKALDKLMTAMDEKGIDKETLVKGLQNALDAKADEPVVPADEKRVEQPKADEAVPQIKPMEDID